MTSEEVGEALHDSGKRKRKSGLDCEERPGWPRPKIDAKQILDSVKEASTKLSYQEAIDSCSRALSDHGLAQSARLQLLLARSGMYSKLDNSPSAIRDAKAAVLLAPQSALAYLRAAKAFHQARLPKKARQALQKAEALDQVQSKKLKRHIDQLKRDWEPHGLLSLPEDVMYEILSFLDTPDLYACFSTCRGLKHVLTYQSGIWGRNVTLSGNLAKIERRWKRLYSFLRGKQVHSLSLSMKSPCPVSRWTSSTLRATFPFSTLYSLHYSGAGNDGGHLDLMVWQDWVSQCKRLKVLHFVNTARQGSLTLEEGTPLTSCRLAELELENLPYPGVDHREDALIRVVSKARRLRLTTYVDAERIRSMVDAAKETLEDLDILVSHEWRDTVNLERRREAIVLSSVQRLSVRWEQSSIPFVLQAPQAKKLALHLSQPREDGTFTHELLQSCASTLTDLAYYSPSPLAAQELDRALPTLAVCERLCMSFAHSASVPALWALLEEQSLATDNDNRSVLLPRLSQLSISGDRTLRGGEVIRLVRHRQSSDLPSIDELSLSSCTDIHQEAVARLRKMVPRFSFSSC